MAREADEARLDLETHLLMAQARGQVAGLRLGSWPFVKRRLILVIDVDHDRGTETDPAFGPWPGPRLGDVIGPGLALEMGPGIQARVAIELDQAITMVGAAQIASWACSAAEITAVARANTMTQPRHQLSTTVIDGPDAGAVITVVTGGPGTAGIVVDLDRALADRALADRALADRALADSVLADSAGADSAGASLPLTDPLVAVASRNVVLVGHFPATTADPGPNSTQQRALANRLRSLSELAQPDQPNRATTPPKRRPPRRRPPILLFREPGRLSIFRTEDP